MKKNTKSLLWILLAFILYFILTFLKHYYNLGIWSIIPAGIIGFIIGYKTGDLLYDNWKLIKTFINDIIYIKYYDKTLYANKLLVLGFLRGIFGHKLFIYINIL